MDQSSTSHLEAVRKWQMAVDPDGAGLFAKRLIWGGLSAADLGSLLTPDATSTGSAPGWWQDLRAMCAFCCARTTETDGSRQDRKPAIPFADLLEPIVVWNRARLRDRQPEV